MIDVEKTIRQYLPDIIHMSLATCVDNKPWVCELHYSYDEDLNLYWRSLNSRRHSQELIKNPNVSGTIVTQHGLDDKTRGVYFEGQAELLTDVDESHPAYLSYSKRFNEGPELIGEARSKDGHKFYKVSVNKYYISDSRESNPPQKHELSWK